MPILIQWKWMERTKSFLVIFHFYDNGRKPNLRFKKKRFSGLLDSRGLAVFPVDEKPISKAEYKFEKTVMTWAPSHPELGYLGEILRYANIIDGLSETEKRELRPKIEIAVHENEYVRIYWEPIRDLLVELSDKIYLLGYDLVEKGTQKEFHFCIELCPEYIDYLRKLLEPYLK